jgi:hypothetical protein
MENKQEERKPMYFRNGAIGVKQFQELTNSQQKDYVASLLLLEEKVLDSSDKYILNFFTKVYFPELLKKNNKKTITMEI